MAPIKFEDKLKDKLENRSLQPSQDVWNTLADRLDKEDNKYNTKRFWWLGIAASLIGVFLITTQFYKTMEAKKDLPIVVDSQSEIPQDSKLITEPVNDDEIIIASDTEEDKKHLETVNATEVATIVNNPKAENQNQAHKEHSLKQPQQLKNTVASSASLELERKENLPVKTVSQEDLKIIEVVDVIKQLQANESSVSEKEIDSLLKQAQRDILKQRIFDETTRTVSADALLQDVEVELEQSFRDKVFEALKSSYNSVKTAVAERRN